MEIGTFNEEGMGFFFSIEPQRDVGRWGVEMPGAAMGEDLYCR